MKHILYATTGIALAMAVSGIAKADVDVLADIQKTKDITITETVTVTKDVTIFVGSSFELDGAAEASALVNVTNTGNEVDGTDPSTPTDQDPEPGEAEYGIHLDASMTDSVNDNTGVFGFNQDVGNMTNQANVVSVAGIANDVEAFADAQSHVDQVNTDNESTELELVRDLEGDLVVLEPDNPILPEELATNKSASIQDSINGNTGVINVNQNAGNMNNQSNALSAAVGIGAVVALSDADLGQHNSGNVVKEFETVKVGSINNSVNGNTGIVNVNQSTGNMNNQGNVVSFAAITSGAIIDSPQ